MEQRDHRDYCLARAEISREAARRAQNPAVAAIHTEMADRYERAADKLAAPARNMMSKVQAA